jgi:hypothetical protein
MLLHDDILFCTLPSGISYEPGAPHRTAAPLPFLSSLSDIRDNLDLGFNLFIIGGSEGESNVHA